MTRSLGRGPGPRERAPRLRILVHEFETGGGARSGGRAVSPSLAVEGAAMRGALLADLAKLPGIDVSATADPMLDVATPPGVRVLPPVHAPDPVFRGLVEQVDAVWLIAPETDRVLERLTAAVEQTRRVVIGPSSAVIRRVSDKAWLARHLAARGVPVPPAPDGTLPVVVKPRRGAGCDHVSLARTRAEVATAKTAVRAVTGLDAFVQKYVAGAAASVSLVSDGRRAVPLAVNAQHVGPGHGSRRQQRSAEAAVQPEPEPDRFAYHGGETPLRHPLAARAVDHAVAACDAVPGLAGYIGVDVVLTADDAIVIEVNPRLTTAYVALRRVLDANIAALVLDACAGELPAAAPAARGRARFTCDGRVQPIPLRGAEERLEPEPGAVRPRATRALTPTRGTR